MSLLSILREVKKFEKTPLMIALYYKGRPVSEAILLGRAYIDDNGFRNADQLRFKVAEKRTIVSQACILLGENILLTVDLHRKVCLEPGDRVSFEVGALSHEM